MYNPFKEITENDNSDNQLINLSLQGDKKALESLILKHQAWIYNISVRMIGDIDDSEDCTQEVLIKIITNLSAFDKSKSSFRTWMYRIAVNHIINKKSSKTELTIQKYFENKEFDEFADSIPDKRKYSQLVLDKYKEETKISCVHCILLCLNKRERMVFILGGIFDVNDKIGSEILDISRENYRQILSRSKNKLYRFFNKNCSLLNVSNPCKCENKINSMIKLNLINTEDLMVDQKSYGNITDILSTSIKNIEDGFYEFNMLFKEQPFLKSPDMIDWLNNLLDQDEIKVLFK